MPNGNDDDLTPIDGIVDRSCGADGWPDGGGPLEDELRTATEIARGGAGCGVLADGRIYCGEAGDASGDPGESHVERSVTRRQ